MLQLLPGQDGTIDFLRYPAGKIKLVNANMNFKRRIMMADTILIIDFGSQVTQLIARRLRESGVYTEILPCTTAK